MSRSVGILCPLPAELNILPTRFSPLKPPQVFVYAHPLVPPLFALVDTSRILFFFCIHCSQASEVFAFDRTRRNPRVEQTPQRLRAPLVSTT